MRTCSNHPLLQSEESSWKMKCCRCGRDGRCTIVTLQPKLSLIQAGSFPDWLDQPRDGRCARSARYIVSVHKIQKNLPLLILFNDDLLTKSSPILTRGDAFLWHTATGPFSIYQDETKGCLFLNRRKP